MLNSNDILKEKKWKWIKNTNYNNVFLSFGGENNAIALVCSNFLKMYNDVASQTKKKKPQKTRRPQNTSSAQHPILSFKNIFIMFQKSWKEDLLVFCPFKEGRLPKKVFSEKILHGAVLQKILKGNIFVINRFGRNL